MNCKIFLSLACICLLNFSVAAAENRTLNWDRETVLNILTAPPGAQSPEIITDKRDYARFTRSAKFLAFNAILEDDSLRYDPEVQAQLRILAETHPFTKIRAVAKVVLSDFRGRKINSMFHYGGRLEGYDGPSAKDLNEDMTYCAPPPEASRPEFEIRAEKEAEARGVRRANYRFDIPLQYGTLSGGYYAINGVGLTYQSDTNSKDTVTINHDNNRYVMPSNIPGEYWLIDGPHHMIGGGTVTKLVETQAGIKRYSHSILPSGVVQVFEMPDGSLFLTFVNLDPTKRGGSWNGDAFTPSPLEWYNPPIRLFPNGEIGLACSS